MEQESISSFSPLVDIEPGSIENSDDDELFVRQSKKRSLTKTTAKKTKKRHFDKNAISTTLSLEVLSDENSNGCDYDDVSNGDDYDYRTNQYDNGHITYEHDNRHVTNELDNRHKTNEHDNGHVTNEHDNENVTNSCRSPSSADLRY
ncbi:33489_t:CDS:2 [Gigaspora margarita]|uniref:33489_t:CDS:1 n=1 Tax=Gigaspora margarita TaxID=4874 RepID=A0ABN7VI47_GIGMA|nr:33489_t:CDS:2 [Gigaspora margarita]